MPAQFPRHIHHEWSMLNTPSPFDGYMQQLDLLYPAQIITLPDGLSTLHIRHPTGRPPTPEWAQTRSPFTPERPHRPVPDHPAFRSPDLLPNHLPSHSNAQRGSRSSYTFSVDGYQVKCAGFDVPPWDGPGRQPLENRSTKPPVVPPSPSPEFSSPAFGMPATPPFYIPGPIDDGVLQSTSGPKSSVLGLPTASGKSLMPNPPWIHDTPVRPGRRVHIRSPPVSQTWIPELPSSSVSTASASSRGTTREPRDANAHNTPALHSPRSLADALSPSSPSAPANIAPPTPSISDSHHDREKRLLQRPRRTVSDLKSKNPSIPAADRSPWKKAVCIGINYHGQRDKELRGCVNDANTIRKFLMSTAGYESQNIIVLTDESSSCTRDSQSQPTYNNIHRALRWLVEGAQAGDSFFLFFSGHGERIPDKSGDEVDGYDKAMVPVDHKTEGYITDDDLHHILVRNLPKRCRLTAVFDACHSGTMLDLPYIYSSSGDLKGTLTTQRAFFAKCSPSDTVSWSSCRDRQTSADTYRDGRPVGAMTHAWVTTLTEKPQQTYRELLGNLKQILRPKYVQKPLLSASHIIDTDRTFVY